MHSQRAALLRLLRLLRGRQVIAFLNGTKQRKLFNLRTLTIKFISCFLAVGSGLPVGPEGPVQGPRAPTVSEMVDEFLKPRPDALNLAGLLNVLDGVVDTPGRMLILTSNHPEKLDPALIRPGRVDRLIHLGYLRCEEAAQMIAHNFGGALSAAQRSRLEAVVEKAARLTPEVLEQQCARHETVDGLLEGLTAQVEAEGNVATTGSTESAVASKADNRAEAPAAAATKADVAAAVTKAELMPPQLQLVKRQPSGG